MYNKNMTHGERGEETINPYTKLQFTVGENIIIREWWNIDCDNKDMLLEAEPLLQMKLPKLFHRVQRN